MTLPLLARVINRSGKQSPSMSVKALEFGIANWCDPSTFWQLAFSALVKNNSLEAAKASPNACPVPYLYMS